MPVFIYCLGKIKIVFFLSSSTYFQLGRDLNRTLQVQLSSDQSDQWSLVAILWFITRTSGSCASAQLITDCNKETHLRSFKRLEQPRISAFACSDTSVVILTHLRPFWPDAVTQRRVKKALNSPTSGYENTIMQIFFPPKSASYIAYMIIGVTKIFLELVSDYLCNFYSSLHKHKYTIYIYRLVNEMVSLYYMCIIHTPKVTILSWLDYTQWI